MDSKMKAMINLSLKVMWKKQMFITKKKMEENFSKATFEKFTIRWDDYYQNQDKIYH